MLYHLLFPLAETHIIFNLFQYLTFRTGGAIMTALFICFIIAPGLITWLKSKQAGSSNIREYLEEAHASKAGTPTMVGASNAVNLTDGLDGLAIVPVAIAAACFGFISYLVGNEVFSEYLRIPYVAGSGELAILCGALIGGAMGFLWYNAPPAKIWMGDTGSLAMGGVLGTIAVIVKHELVLAIVGGLFVLETVSVIVQVVSFKLTGKRVFAMAPLHHHFEKKGWSEPTIVIRFWIIAVILALIGLATLKLR